MNSPFRLLTERRFAPFFGTQFLGAFNDNLFKNALVVVLTFHAVEWSRLAPELLANLAAGVFILPFFLFSASAGQLADKFDKARIARLVKLLEMVIMAVAAAGFAWHSLALLMTALFLFGAHSTLFGPVKYAILPQHLREDELIDGNALVEGATFVAILLGTIAGGVLAGLADAQDWVAAAGFAVAAVGYACSRGIPPAPPPAPGLRLNRNPLSETWRNVGQARETREVFVSILGISWFWLYGALLLTQFPAYAKHWLGGAEGVVTLLLAAFSIGIGLGSMLCARLSGSQVEPGMVTLGAIGMSLFGLDLAFAGPGQAGAAAPLGAMAFLGAPAAWRVLFDVLSLGVAGGFFIVPLYVLMQTRSAADHRARVVAANNIFNAAFMVAGAAAAALLLGSGLSIPGLFGVAAICNAAAMLLLCRGMPAFWLRFLGWFRR